LSRYGKSVLLMLLQTQFLSYRRNDSTRLYLFFLRILAPTMSNLLFYFFFSWTWVATAAQTVCHQKPVTLVCRWMCDGWMEKR
jgi:superfamily I DNA and RNA helicase